MNKKLAKNYKLIAKRIRAKKKLLLVLGDGNIYRVVYDWKNEPDEEDIVGWFDENDDLQIGYITESDWDMQYQEWFFTVIRLLPYSARLMSRAVISKRPELIAFTHIDVVLRKVKKAVRK